jgi:hypothetical protein
MKKLLEKQKVFDITLKLLSLLSKSKLTEKFIVPITTLLARININLNKPRKTRELSKLAEIWKELMPPDGQNNFKVEEINQDTAFVEIHLHCPLRGTGKVNTCYSFMNYDRELMKSVGGSLTVLESQSNSGKPYCKLAIRKIESPTEDLVPAHLKSIHKSLNNEKC